MAKGKRKKWEKRGEKTGKSTFWPGHAPWATASSGVPAGPAEIEFGSGHAWQASGRQAGAGRQIWNLKKEKNRFSNSITNTFPQCFLCQCKCVFYSWFIFIFFLSFCFECFLACFFYRKYFQLINLKSLSRGTLPTHRYLSRLRNVAMCKFSKLIIPFSS